MSGLSVLMWMSLFGMFFGGGTMFNAELLLGLAVFSGITW